VSSLPDFPNEAYALLEASGLQLLVAAEMPIDGSLIWPLILSS
jgi:hypothetical protein